MKNNNSVLLIFDETLNINYLRKISRSYYNFDVAIFSLTGDISVIEHVEKILTESKVKSLFRYNTASLFHEEVKKIKDTLLKWSSKSGNYLIYGKTIKEWFLLPRCDVSTWWYSLLSGRNTFKTDAFFQIAQVRVIKEILKKDKHDLVSVAVGNPIIKKCIDNLAKSFKIHLKSLRTIFFKKNRIKFVLNNSIGNILLSVLYLIRFLWHRILATYYLGDIKLRLPEEKSLLFVTYFPSLEKDSINKKVFNNKYTPVLQHKLKEMKMPVIWLLIFVKMNDFNNFKKAAKLAKFFVDNKEKLIFLEEYFTLKDAVLSFIFWIRQAFLAFFVYFLAIKSIIAIKPLGKEFKPIIRSIWFYSFCGTIGIESIIYSFVFNRIFKNMNNITKCIYFCEMQAWEKALNAGKRNAKASIATIGYQHSSISENYFYYFFDKADVMRTGENTDLPLPDILACNGKVPYSMLVNMGFPKVLKVEAIRYLYLNRFLSIKVNEQKKNVLLIAGSIDRKETLSLISFVIHALHKPLNFEIWCKGHPAMPIERIFLESGIDIKAKGYKIIHNDISECLINAKAAVVPSSTVAIEAIAFGCEVIIPVLPDSMLMSPLADFGGEYCHIVTSSEEFEIAIKKIFSGYKLKSIEEYRDFVKRYWELDESIKEWIKLVG